MARILTNAHIHTLDKENPEATAVLILNGRFQIVVDGDELSKNFPNVPVENMKGRVILPGLTDSHLHLQHYAMSLQSVDCETETLSECLNRVENKAQTANSGDWILGHGWNQNKWKEGFGTAAMLDNVAPENPVYLTAKSLHAGWANSRALALAGIDQTTPDPENGRIGLDSDEQPNGILIETAMNLVQQVIPEQTKETIARNIDLAQSKLWEMGITGIHDFDKKDCFIALQQLHTNGKLKLRVLKSIPSENLDHAIGMGIKSSFGDDILRIGSLKLFSDGALGPHTAAMLKPYDDEPDNIGNLSLDNQQVLEIGMKAVSNGISLAIHAIGDRANRAVLDGLSQLRRFEQENGIPSVLHRIEHVQVLHSSDINRLAELNLVASMQPVHQPSDMLIADKCWGKRSKYAYAWRTQLQQGAVLAFGSDAPVESPNPFLGIHAAVTRRAQDGSPDESGWYPEERLTVEETLLGFTEGPAITAGMQNRLGKIKSNFLADLIVLDGDPFEMDPMGLKDIKPVATMVAGDWVYQA